MIKKFVYLFGGGLLGLAIGAAVIFHHRSINWQDNGLNQPRLVAVIQGKVTGTVTGVVETDTDCTADSSGLSHCHNVIALTNHQPITVIYTHNINRVQCLIPNESVTVKAVNTHWATVIVNSV